MLNVIKYINSYNSKPVIQSAADKIQPIQKYIAYYKFKLIAKLKL